MIFNSKDALIYKKVKFQKLKMISLHAIVFNVIILSFFTLVLNDPCKYQLESGGNTLDTNSTTLEGLPKD